MRTFAFLNQELMKKELGKWLMDIAKYIATAVILSSVFGEIETWQMYVIGSVAVVGTLLSGLSLLSDKPERTNVKSERK